MVWMLVVAIFLLIFQVCYFRSAALLPLGSHNACFQTTLLVTMALVASCCFGEQLGSIKPITLVLAIVGLFLVAQPEPLFPHNDVSVAHLNIRLHSNSSRNAKICSTPTGTTQEKSSPFQITTSGFLDSPPVQPEEDERLGVTAATMGYILVIAAGSLETITILVTKHRCHNIDPLVLCMWVALVIMFLSLPMAIYFETIMLDYTTQEVFFLLGHSLASTVQCIFILVAIQNISSVIMSMVYGMSVVFSFCLQYTALTGIFPGHGNWVEVLGAAMTLAGIVMASVAELIQERVNGAI